MTITYPPEMLPKPDEGVEAVVLVECEKCWGVGRYPIGNGTCNQCGGTGHIEIVSRK
jgi:DnaJ-class molecular chaperone